MSYEIKLSNGSSLTSIDDYTTNTTSTSLSLPGRGVENYGLMLAEDLVYMLENFSSSEPPSNPLNGQIWFQKFESDVSGNSNTVNRMFYYADGNWILFGNISYGDEPKAPDNGAIWIDPTDNMMYYRTNNMWKSSSSYYISQNPPTDVTPADGFTWLMIPENMVWTYDSSITAPNPSFKRTGGTNDGTLLSGSWRQIGAQYPSNLGMMSYYQSVPDTSGAYHSIIVNSINDIPIYVSSYDTFEMDLSKSDALSNFKTMNDDTTIGTTTAKIYSGITMNSSIGSTMGLFGGLAIAAKNIYGMDVTDFLGRGKDPSVTPTYPATDSVTDLGSLTNRWRNFYTLDVYASDNMFINDNPVATQLWSVDNLIQKTNSSYDKVVDVIGINAASGYCYMHQQGSSNYQYLPDVDQVKTICLPLSGGTMSGDIDMNGGAIRSGSSSASSAISFNSNNNISILATDQTNAMTFNFANSGKTISIDLPTSMANGSTAITQPSGDNSTKLATTAFVTSSSFIPSNPGQYGSNINNMFWATNVSPQRPYLSYNGGNTYLATFDYVQGNYLPLTGGVLSGSLVIGSSAGTTLYVGNGTFNYTQGSQIAWNTSGGGGETDFINYQGTGGGGFNFYNGSPGSYSKIASISSNGTFSPLAVSAEYADLAEKYIADKLYKNGTLVKIGGENEITSTTTYSDIKVFGVISENPAYLMNSNMTHEFSLPVALEGRLGVRIIGKIEKGDFIISSDIPGVGCGTSDPSTNPLSIIGRSLESSSVEEEKYIECYIGR